MKRIALATGAKLPTLNEDDLLLVPPLRELGVTAVPAVWDSPDVCWEEFQGVVVRSCWDYHHRLEEFLGWVVRLERAGIPVWNPPAVLRWNSHKIGRASCRERVESSVVVVVVEKRGE